MIHFEDVNDVDKALIHNHLVFIQIHLNYLSRISSARPLVNDLMNFKDFIDLNVRLSDEVPF